MVLCNSGGVHETHYPNQYYLLRHVKMSAEEPKRKVTCDIFTHRSQSLKPNLTVEMWNASHSFLCLKSWPLADSTVLRDRGASEIRDTAGKGGSLGGTAWKLCLLLMVLSWDQGFLPPCFLYQMFPLLWTVHPVTRGSLSHRQTREVLLPKLLLITRRGAPPLIQWLCTSAWHYQL